MFTFKKQYYSYAAFIFFLFSFVPLAKGATTDKVGFTSILGATVGGGTMKSETGSLKSRKIANVGVRFFPGWNFGSVMVGAMGQYRVVTQITKASQVDNTNVGGHGYYAGPGLAFRMGSILLQASYDFLGNEMYFKKTASGNSQAISSPTGFTIILGFKNTATTWLDVFFSTHKFSKSITSGNAIEIDDNRVQETVFGLGISY